MSTRTATPDDAAAIAAIYVPIVLHTAISFEIAAPTEGEMRARIEATLVHYPWLVSLDDAGAVDGYVYASRHRDRAAYQWSVDTTAYVREDRRGKGVARRLYTALFAEVTALGHCQAFAGITLPNEASVALHEHMGFTKIGAYRNVGFKLGEWHDVGWWQKTLQAPASPSPPRAFSQR
jgi:L-amino acid N-acyltransferase YncA